MLNGYANKRVTYNEIFASTIQYLFIDLEFTYILVFYKSNLILSRRLSYHQTKDVRSLLIVAVCSAREALFIM